MGSIGELFKKIGGTDYDYEMYFTNYSCDIEDIKTFFFENSVRKLIIYNHFCSSHLVEFLTYMKLKQGGVDVEIVFTDFYSSSFTEYELTNYLLRSLGVKKICEVNPYSYRLSKTFFEDVKMGDLPFGLGDVLYVFEDSLLCENYELEGRMTLMFINGNYTVLGDDLDVSRRMMLSYYRKVIFVQRVTDLGEKEIMFDNAFRSVDRDKLEIIILNTKI